MNPPASVSARTPSKPGRRKQAEVTLSEEFLAPYAERQPAWGPLGWITYKRTYARWADRSQTRREEWWETVRRVVEGNVNMDPRPRTPEVVAELEAEAKEMFETIFSLAWTPPGRGLWISGTDYAKRVGDALINCVSGDTLVHTDRGLVPARQLAGRQVPTLSQGGVLRPATWSCHGEQELYRVTFANGDVIEATAGHEWVVGDRRVTTLQLAGEAVPMQPRSEVPYDQARYEQGLAHGHRFGAPHSRARASSSRAILISAGDRATSIARRSELEEDIRSDVVPSAEAGLSYLRGFFAGMVEARGFIGTSGAVILQCPEGGAALRQLAAGAGLPSSAFELENGHDRLTGAPRQMTVLHFAPEAFRDVRMLLRDDHRSALEARAGGSTSVTVASVEPTGRIEPVYCCVEPETHTWVAGPGYLTGNCWYIDVVPRSYEDSEGAKPSYPFCFAMDRLMAGGGVGFGVTIENATQFPPVSNPVSLHIVCDLHHANFRELEADQIPQTTHTTVRVEDSREGWVDALRVLIDAHFKAKRQRHLVVDVSDVRPAGADIKGFGGTSAGPGPLVQLLRAANGILNDRVGVNLTPVDCTDVMNMVGRAVVAGNVRRSAEIALGSANDLGFISMKQDQEKLMSHRWASNNSIVIDGEFEDFGRIANAISANGEPGIFNLELARTRLRLCDDASDERNLSVGGTNPCFTGDQLLLTTEGEVPFIVLYERGTPVSVLTDERVTYHSDGTWSVRSDGEGLTARRATQVELTRESAEVVSLTLASGRMIRCTPDHRVATAGGMVPVGELTPGEAVLTVDGTDAAVSVVAAGFEDVYCLSEPETHSIIVGGVVAANCGEIVLDGAGESCNLAEVFPAVIEREGLDMERILRLALRYTKRVTCARYSWAASADIVARNRRVGVSLSGIRDWMLARGVRDLEDLAGDLDRWYRVIRDEDSSYSAILGIPTSVAVSTVKPSGTVSLMNGSSPGLHAHQAPYFIRRIRLAAKDTLVDLIRQCGFHVEDDAYAPNTVVAEFPVKAPGADEKGFVSAAELSLEEQFETQATLQRWWSDNAVSATLTFRKDERRKIAPLLLAFRDQIKSTSLLPYTDPGESTTYVQMPYEPITRERYEEMMAEVICWPHEVATQLHETRRQEFDIVDQADCAGGACPIK